MFWCKKPHKDTVVYMPDGEEISFTMQSLSKAERIYVTALVVGQIAIAVIAILIVVDKVAW